MKITQKILISGFLLLMNFGCESDSSTTITTPPSDLTGCPEGQNLGCDDNCSESPLQNDACGVCGGSTFTESDCPITQCDTDVCISFINVDMDINKFDIWMVNSVHVAGFQFKITGLTITNISGGTTEEYGLSVSKGSNNLILGFSFGGEIIPIGNGVLFQVTFSNFNDNICFTEPIFSGQSGSSLSVILGECYK